MSALTIVLLVIGAILLLILCVWIGAIDLFIDIIAAIFNSGSSDDSGGSGFGGGDSGGGGSSSDW